MFVDSSAGVLRRRHSSRNARANQPDYHLSGSILNVNLILCPIETFLLSRRVMTVKYQGSLIAVLFFGLLFATARPALAQSSDQSLPTPISSNEINASIAPLDLGDSRLTRHFYAFEANPGDLIVTLDSKNLNGDVDVFTAVSFRPLMKITMYESAQAPEISKSIYLRAHQILILRVEARTPNDEPGSYHLRFRGSFEPFSSGIPVAEATESAAETPRASRGTKRLSSVGATIAEPPVETAAKVEPPKAEPTPSPETVEKPAAEKETPKPEAGKPGTPKTTARSTTRNTRRNPSRTRAPASAKTTAKTSTAKPESETTKPEPEAAKQVTPPEEKPAAETKRPEDKPQEIVAPQPGARLTIEEKDGTRIDRPMSSVRRVVVEGNVIMIVLKTGRIERVPMSAVTKMAIEP
jgi:hypothetical protein